MLIFDDDAVWAKQIALSLKDRFATTQITEPSDWDVHIRSTYWDAIVVDVRILGNDDNGPEMAEKSILEYEVTTPVIVISVADLRGIERKHGRVFFGYVRKANYNAELPALVDQACKPLGRSTYLRNMLTEFARRFGVLRDTFPDSMVDYDSARRVITNSDCQTIKDLIAMIGGGPKHELSNMAIAVLRVIRWAKERKEH